MYLHHFKFTHMFLKHIGYQKHENTSYEHIYNVVKFHMEKFFTSDYNRDDETLEKSIQTFLDEKITVSQKGDQ
jgi:hypothetical protein